MVGEGKGLVPSHWGKGGKMAQRGVQKKKDSLKHNKKKVLKRGKGGREEGERPVWLKKLHFDGLKSKKKKLLVKA